jgi:succinate dehydrogenase / fumarate reductase cytochrome b subunit
MFLLLPLVIWFFDTSVSSEVSFERFTSAFSSGLGIVPAWLLKLVSLGLIWGYLHHMFAGIRHLIMDIDHHAVNNQFGKTSGLTAIGLAIVLTLLLGARLFGLY